MIYFDQETRLFSNFTQGLKSVGSSVGHAARTSTAKQWGVAAAAGRVAIGLHQRKELQKKYEDQGMDPDEARKKAKKESGSIAKNAIKGAVTGMAARKAGHILGLKATSNDRLQMAKRENGNLKTRLQAAQIDAKNMKLANEIDASNKEMRKQLKNLK